MTPQDILNTLDWRYAVKKFDSAKKISPEHWKVLEESLVKSPSSYGLQPWKFLIVQDPQVRTQLKAASWNQSQVTDCSHYVVMLYKKQMDIPFVEKYIQRIAQVRGVTLESLQGFKNGMIGDLIKGPRAETIKWWAQRQTYIAMGFLLETAALLKIDTCAMEGLDPAAYDKILGLESSEWATVACVALGYRHAEDVTAQRKKIRFENKDIIEWR